MPKFSNHSEEQLKTVHPILRAILRIAILLTDFRVLEGFRNEERQNELFNATPPKTRVRWPNSKHNQTPSLAVDFAPWPIDWNDTDRFYYVGGIIMGVGFVFLKAFGLTEKYALRYGGDWDRDGELSDNKFNDLGHIELVILDAS